MASVKKQVTYAFQSQKYASSRQFYCVLMFLVIMYVMVVYNFALTYFNGDTLVSAKETSVEETEFIQVIRNFFDRDYVSQRMLLEERQILNEKLKNYSLFELEEPIRYADPSNIARTYAIVPPNIKLEEKLRVVYKKRLAACVIEKNMSTVLASIMCFLEDNKAFAEANRTITGEHFWTRFCKDKNEHNSIEDLLRTTHTKLEDWIMFALVRDPLERLLSAFVDKCILNRESKMDKSCYGCKQNIRCFVRNVYWRAKSFAENHEKNYNMEDVHTFPQNWHCSFKDRTTKMKIIKYYSEFKERKRTYARIVDVLKEADIRPALISEVLDQIMAGSTYHTTVNSPEKELARKKVTNSEDLMDMIYSLYYHDYLMFDFPFEYKDVHV